jgi:transcriptional regulator with XRE-family HTH domain
LNLRDFQARFARRVRLLREGSQLRQDDLEEFEISWKSVQKLEYGVTDPKVSTLLKLCKAFKMDLAELLTFDDDPVRTKEASPPRPQRKR